MRKGRHEIQPKGTSFQPKAGRMVRTVAKSRNGIVRSTMIVDCVVSTSQLQNQ